jgi:hypothetical protein
MTLFHYPLISVDSITEDGVVLGAEKYRVHKDSGIVLHLDGVFLGAEETIVAYTAGYAAVPSPILSVLDSIVQERYNKKMSGVDLNFGSDVQRISIPGAIAIDFDYSLSNNNRSTPFGVVLGSNINILDYYRSDRVLLGHGKLVYVTEAVPPGP